MIQRTANLGVEVRNVTEAIAHLSRQVEALGGYVLDSSRSSHHNGHLAGTNALTAKIMKKNPLYG